MVRKLLLLACVAAAGIFLFVHTAQKSSRCRISPLESKLACTYEDLQKDPDGLTIITYDLKSGACAKFAVIERWVQEHPKACIKVIAIDDEIINRYRQESAQEASEITGSHTFSTNFPEPLSNCVLIRASL